MQRKDASSRAAHALVVVAVAGATAGVVAAQVLPDPLLQEHLRTTPPLSQVEKSVPDPVELQQYIRNKAAALKLGKALFWDMQVGSDGFTSCASCHFHAGADNRSRNQVSPGVIATPKDISFSEELGGGPNYQLTLDDFPLHKLSNPDDRASSVERDINDVISSQGVHFGIFVSADSGREVVEPAPDPDGFQLNGLNVRRVEPRNTPTVINAVFNKILFWDGRAKDVFNGVNPSGAANTLIYRATSPDQLTPFSVQLQKAPLASLAVGPPLSLFEMSASRRPFVEIGDKLLGSMKRKQGILARKGRTLRSVRPLVKQMIHPQDSVLAAESRSPFPGREPQTTMP